MAGDKVTCSNPQCYYCNPVVVVTGDSGWPERKS